MADEELLRTRARSNTRVARSTSTDSFEEGAGATASARRWSVAETRSRLERAPRFAVEPPSSEILTRLVQYYEAVTGDPVRTAKKRNFVATCYRVHGADFAPLLEEEFARRGTAANLLAILRSAPRRAAQSEPTAVADHEGPPCPIERCIADVIYCEAHRPPFDPTSSERWDRHRSNPAAAVYFDGTGDG